MNCSKCLRSDVKLIDAIDGVDIIKICEECLITENLPAIRKVSSEQLEENIKPKTKGSLKDELKYGYSLDKLRKPKDYKQELAEKFSQAKKNNAPLNLIDNYNWHIAVERKKKKISMKQLAEAIAVPEEAIRMIEEKLLPDDALRIIKKIEQYLSISIHTYNQKEIEEIKKNYIEEIKKENAARQAMDIYPKKEEVALKFDKESLKDITLADLKKIKDEKEKSKEEAVEGEAKEEVKEDKEIKSLFKRIWNWARNKEQKEESKEADVEKAIDEDKNQEE